jgi:hypothetical protein
MSSDKVWVRLTHITTTIAVALCWIAALIGRWNGYLPSADMSMIAWRAIHVGTRWNPLLGTRSSVISSSGAVMHHPGPSEFWVLAPFVRLFGSWGMPLGGALITSSSIVGLVWLVRRVADPATAFVVAAGSVALLAAMGTTVIAEPWPPYAVIFPICLSLTAAWATVRGDPAGRLLLVIAASFVAQAQLSAWPVIVPITLGAIAFAGVATWRSAGMRSCSRVLITPVLVGAVVWALPIYQQVRGPNGNFSILMSQGTNQPSQGVGRAAEALTGVLSSPLGWTGNRWAVPWIPLHGDTLDVGRPVPVLIAIVGSALLVALAALVVNRCRPAVWLPPFAVIGFSVVLSLVGLSRAPSNTSVPHSWLRWLFSIGLMVWCIPTGMLLARLQRRWAQLMTVAVVLVIVGASLLSQAQRTGSDVAAWRTARQSVDRLADGISMAEPRGALNIRSAGFAVSLGATVGWRLFEHDRAVFVGVPLGVDPNDPRSRKYSFFGSDGPSHPPAAAREIQIYLLDQPGSLPPEGQRVIACSCENVSMAMRAIELRRQVATGENDETARTELTSLESELARDPAGFAVATTIG